MAVEKILMFHMAVTDMAKAKEFYADKLGFKVTKDSGQGDQHWVSLEAPGGGPSLNLTTMHENMKPGTMKLYLSTPDIEAAYQELKAKGSVNACVMLRRDNFDHPFVLCFLPVD